jgi:hypothetical protein
MAIGWRKHRVLAIASGTIVCTVILLSIALTSSEVVTDPGLGNGWECRSTLFLTSCTKVERTTPVPQSVTRIADLEKICPLRLDERAGNARSAPFTWSVAGKFLDDRP